MSINGSGRRLGLAIESSNTACKTVREIIKYLDTPGILTRQYFLVFENSRQVFRVKEVT